MATLQDFRNERLKKLEKLRALGVNPYPSKTDRTVKNSEVKLKFEEFEGQKVKVVGRIKNLRIMGKIGFIVIKDESGSLQLFASEDNLGSADYANSELAFKDLRLLDSGDFVEGDGEVIKTKTGEISVKLNKIRILTKAIRPMPLAHEEFSDIESRYRQRYIDMNVNEDVKNDIILRSKVTQILREFLVERDFLEIETPVLQPIYGGASARPFKTYHNKLESDFFLRISPELYLKKAVAGGFERVFEFSRNFRNEGIDRSHNPEFTMLEFYRTYADYNDLMEMTTEMMHNLLNKVFGKLSFDYQGHKLDFSIIKKYTFRELILEKMGLDIDEMSREDLIKEIKSRNIEADLKAPTKDLLDEFYKETCRKDIIQPIYLIDYPREMIPLAKRKTDNPKYIESLQLVCCGFELLKAYSELNDPIDQLERLTEDQKALDDGTSEEAMTVDLDFVAALEVGIPPTAGWGMGIDRLVSFLADKPAIKDVIMFPTLRPEDVDEATKKMYPEVKFNNLNKLEKKQGPK
jgi:lysyl-tRNA synthetase class 2